MISSSHCNFFREQHPRQRLKINQSRPQGLLCEVKNRSQEPFVHKLPGTRTQTSTINCEQPRGALANGAITRLPRLQEQLVHVQILLQYHLVKFTATTAVAYSKQLL